MNKDEFMARVSALNLLAEKEKVQNWAKELIPECITLDMGYAGGYSMELKNGVLKKYDGREPDEEFDDHFFEETDENYTAFGTIQIGVGTDEGMQGLYQLYHTGINGWRVDFCDEKGENVECIELGSYINAIQFLIMLSKKLKQEVTNN